MVRSRVLLAAALCAAAGLAAAPAPADAAQAATEVDRTIRDPRVSESSGLAVSLRHPGVLWTHGDSGNPPVLYAVGRDGAVAAALRLRGAGAVDWEAMAAFRDDAGRAVLAVADIGDNAARRPSVRILLVPEPARLRDATVAPSRVLTLRYPDGPRDAEALLVDAEAGRMFVVTKGLGSVLFQVPTDVWPGRAGGRPASSGTLQRIASVPLILVTDGAIGPGHHPVLRTYGELAVLPPVTPDVAGGSLEPLTTARLPGQKQGEGLALAADGQVLLSSEGVGQPVLRLPPPAELAAALASGAASGSPVPGTPVPGTTGSAADPPRSTTTRSGDGAGGSAGPPALLLFGAAVLVAGAVGAAVGLRRR